MPQWDWEGMLVQDFWSLGMVDCPSGQEIVTDSHNAIAFIAPYTLCSRFSRTGRFANVEGGFMKQVLSCNEDGHIQNIRDVTCNADCSMCHGTTADNTLRTHVYEPDGANAGLLGLPGPCWPANVTTGTPLAVGSMRVRNFTTQYGELSPIDTAFDPCGRIEALPSTIAGADFAAAAPMLAAAVITFSVIGAVVGRRLHSQSRAANTEACGFIKRGDADGSQQAERLTRASYGASVPCP